jgi:hypothetical protein
VSSIVFRCSLCGQVYDAPSTFAGRTARCRTCGHHQPVVGPEPPPAKPSVYSPAPIPIPSSHPTSAPPRPRREAPDGWAPALRGAASEHSQVQGLAVILLLLSTADLLMTFTLLRAHRAFVESNPIAQWFFVRWNMMGMALFKFGVIGGVIALSELIERRRPGYGRFVLLVGCLGAAYAVVKGLSLYTGHARGDLQLD